MDYSHDILSFFSSSSFPQPTNPEWIQPASSVTLVGDLENDDSCDEQGYPSSGKSLTTHNGSNDTMNSCLNSTRRAPANYNSSPGRSDAMTHSLNLHNTGSPVPYAPQTHSQTQPHIQQLHQHSRTQHPQFVVSVDDTSMPELHFSPDLDRRPSDYLAHSSAHQVHQGSPFDLFHMGLHRSSPAKTRVPSPSSSTRRSSSHLDHSPVSPLVTADDYPNYTTSSPLKFNYNLSGSPRKKHLYMYLGRHSGPHYRAGASKSYEIVRGIASGSVTRPPYPTSLEEHEYVPVELKVTGASVEEINDMPWNYEEQQDGRRIIRMERRQEGHVVTAHFSVVGSAIEHPIPERAPPNVTVVEVSCLKYSSNGGSLVGAHTEDAMEDRNLGRPTYEDDANIIRYSITSVEVVNIIEALIGSTKMSSSLLRKEKGRIRSNLMPFWSKKPLSSKKSQGTNEKADPRTDFARRIMRYKARKPRGFDKDVRVLAWGKLVPALHRAMQCYYAEIPCNDLISPSEDTDRGE